MRWDLPTLLRHRGMMGLVTISSGLVLLGPVSPAFAGDPLRPDPAPRAKPAPIAPDPAPTVQPRTSPAPDVSSAQMSVSRPAVTNASVARPKPKPVRAAPKKKEARHVAPSHARRPIAQPTRLSHDESFGVLPSRPSDADQTAILLAVLALAVLVTSSVSLLQLARRAREI